MRLLGLLLGCIAATFVPGASASALPGPLGALTPLAGIAGCVSGDGSSGLCSTARGFDPDGYPMMAMSPDGRNVYTAEDDGPGVVLTFARDPATGALAELLGLAGCVSANGTDGAAGACTPATAIQGAIGVAVSPDGKNVYVAARGTANAVAVFARDATSGALTQLAGKDGCVSEDGSGGACADGAGLTGARGITVSPDGQNVYVAADGGALSIFTRDGTTGALTQPPGMGGCISQGATDGCRGGAAMAGARDVVLSADGGTVYVAAEDSDAVDVFQRVVSPPGALVQLPLPEGCIARTGADGCWVYPPLVRPRSVAVTPFPDATNVYVASLGAPGVMALRRGPDGALTPLSGTGGCVTADGSSGECASGRGLVDANGVALSPDGLNVYVASIQATDDGAVAVFARDPASGAITQLPGTTGCLSDNGSGGICTAVPSLVSPDWVSPSPDGRHVYVGDTGLAGVSALTRELPPACVAAAHAVQSGRANTVALSCGDPNGDPITLSIASVPAHGSLGALDQKSGSILYTPKPGYAGSDSFSFAANDGSLGSAPAVASLTVTDRAAPVISRASISPRALAPTRAKGAKVKRGAMIRYRLSEPASVSFTVQRKASGRRVGHSCRPVSRKNRGKRRCTRYVKVGTLTQRGIAGADRKLFSGRIHGKPLKPRAYRLVMGATDPSHNHAKPRRLAFRIVRAHRAASH
jgi:DNA-binding beta-propeller fold protein YncE